SKLGHLTLFFCTLHAYLWWTPPGYMLCLVFLVLKLLILLPCVDRSLSRIRKGWERRSRRAMAPNH
ncbi:hypothetical protein CRUP_034621, partial [Coryphaenoides rupestris]